MEKQVRDVISELQSRRGSGLYGALITLRTTLIKSQLAVKQLIKQGAFKLLIDILDDTECHTKHSKILDIVMSIVANLCYEDIVKNQIIDNDLLKIIEKVTLSSEQESIHNRGIRALANLAHNTSNCDKIIENEVPMFVAKRLMETEDEECRATYIRALGLFCQTEKGHKRLVQESPAVQALAAVLKLDNKKLALKSLRILSEISSVKCCLNFAGQILVANVLEELVTLADDADNDIAFFAFSIILKLCEVEHTRPALGSAGVTSVLLKHLKGERIFVDKVLALNALCMCTKDSVSRVKIRESGGLDFLVFALQGGSNGTYARLYDRLISALVNFMYCDKSIIRLLKLDLLHVLVGHLRRCCHLSDVEIPLRKQVFILADAAMTSKNREDRICQGVDSDNNIKCDDINVDQEPDSESLTVSKSVGLSNISSHHKMDYEAGDKVIVDGGSLEQSIDREDPLLIDSSLNTDDDGLAAMLPEDQSQDKVNSSEDPLLIDSTIATDSDGLIVNQSQNKHNDPLPKAGTLATDGKSHKKCFKGEDPLAINSALATDRDDVAVTSSEDQLQFIPTSSASSHIFSINSPTYQIENSWRIEDYSSGVTCKTFNSNHNFETGPYCVSNQSMSPYSPLSAVSTFCSPVPSSSSPNSLFTSPRKASPSGSPFSSSSQGQGSPAWWLDSIEQGTPPTLAQALGRFSPLQSPSSPLSPCNDYGSASPAQMFSQEDQSPTPASQRSEPDFWVSQSLFSQKTVVSNDGAHEALIFSASEDDSSDENIAEPHLDESDSIVEPPPIKDVQEDGSCLSDDRKPEIVSHPLNIKNESPICSTYQIKNAANINNFVLQDNLTSAVSNPSFQKQESLTRTKNPKAVDRNFDCPLEPKRRKLQSFIDTNQMSGSKQLNCTASASTSHCERYLDVTTFKSNYRSLFTHVPYIIPNDSVNVQAKQSLESITMIPVNNNNIGNETTDNRRDERKSKILRTSEQNILYLLSQISLKNNPKELLTEANFISCLLNYIRAAERPQKRCFRILHRLCGNPLCFEKLILLQIPALLIKLLVLDEDGLFPRVMFISEWRNQFGALQRSRMNLSDLLQTSSQSSEDAGSQKSELGKLMELEFGGDAYSKMVSTSSKPGKTWLWDSLSDDIFGFSSDRVEVRVHIGLKLLDTMFSVAMSRFGKGEIDHVLVCFSAQDRLACLISLLSLTVACTQAQTRRSFLKKYNFWEQLVPYLFIPEAALAREAIVAGLSFNLHLENPSKSVVKISYLQVCCDLKTIPNACDIEPTNLRDFLDSQMSSNETQGLMAEESTNFHCNKKFCSCGKLCPYSAMSVVYDVNFVVHFNNQTRQYGASKELLITKSSVFAAMLSGGYMESSKSEIALMEVNFFGFEFAIHYLHGCTNGCNVIDLKSHNIYESTADGFVVSDLKSKTDISMTSTDGTTSEMQEAPELTNSQDSLGALSLNDDGKGPKPLAPSSHPRLLDLINKCADILEVADRYLLTDVTQYVTSVLSHTCLQPDTCLPIFYLSCFYQLDGLSADCMRETLLSHISCQEAADIYVQLVLAGYQEQAKSSLLTLLKLTFQDEIISLNNKR